MSRTRGADIDDKTAHSLLGKNVALGKCTPVDLWKLRSISASGVTSDWAAIKAAQRLLSDVLDETGGKGINQKLFAKQLDTWLRSHGMCWQFVEVETCVKRLRAMFSTLLAVRREQKSVPRNFEMIHAVAVKMVLETSPAKISRGRVAASNDDDDGDFNDDDVGHGLQHEVQDHGSRELQGTEEDELDKCASALFTTPKKLPTPTAKPKQPLLRIQKSNSFTLFTLVPMAAGSRDVYSRIQTMVDDEPLQPPRKAEYAELSKKNKRGMKVTLALQDFLRPYTALKGIIRLHKALYLIRPHEVLLGLRRLLKATQGLIKLLKALQGSVRPYNDMRS